jgi:single-stranded-DNA-specific exonuclease
VSRIQGDACFCVELLTTGDRNRAKILAEKAELANTRRKSLQKDIAKSVNNKLAKIDLSTTSVIVLDDPQWSSGVLGLVAGQIAQEYGRPTVLLTTASEGTGQENLARGSARSVNNIDLYQLLLSQSHLLHRFGGHPFAAGLSIPVENLALFRDAINQELRQKVNINLLTPVWEMDIIVTVADLGKNLFKELKLLEPCGMGNPVPKLLIQNCWFTKVWNTSKNVKKQSINYIKTAFNICDRSFIKGFPGIWWGHNKEELPQGELEQLSDAIIELDWNDYTKQYEVRLIATRPSSTNNSNNQNQTNFNGEFILDCRGENRELLEQLSEKETKLITQCPQSWDELEKEYKQAVIRGQKLALAYNQSTKLSTEQIWKKLIGIAKYLSRTGEIVTKPQLTRELEISDRLFHLALETLNKLGFQYQNDQEYLQFQIMSTSPQLSELELQTVIINFLAAVEEEKFQQQYFYQVSFEEIKTMLAHD